MRTILRNRIVYTALLLFDHLIAPTNIAYTASLSSDPVLRASVKETKVATTVVYDRIRALGRELGHGKDYPPGGDVSIVKIFKNSEQNGKTRATYHPVPNSRQAFDD